MSSNNNKYWLSVIGRLLRCFPWSLCPGVILCIISSFLMWMGSLLNLLDEIEWVWVGSVTLFLTDRILQTWWVVTPGMYMCVCMCTHTHIWRERGKEREEERRRRRRETCIRIWDRHIASMHPRLSLLIWGSVWPYWGSPTAGGV